MLSLLLLLNSNLFTSLFLLLNSILFTSMLFLLNSILFTSLLLLLNSSLFTSLMVQQGVCCVLHVSVTYGFVDVACVFAIVIVKF